MPWKAYHLRLILRPYRSNLQPVSGAADPLPGILIGIRPNGWRRKLLIRNTRWVQNYSCVDRADSVLGHEQRIDVDLSNARVLDDKPAEPDEDALQQGGINRSPASNSFQRRKDFGLFHQTPRQSRIKRRQRKRAVSEDFHEFTAKAKQNNGTELRVLAATENQFITSGQHALNGDALEVARSGFLLDRLPN